MWIEAGSYRADLRPEHGGLIAALQFRGRNGWCDILLSEPQSGAVQDGLALFGSFPMVPFANRLPQAWLPFGAGRVDFARNWPSEGIAHHGTGWGQIWQVDQCQSAAVWLSTRIVGAAGQALGLARQHIEITPDGMRARLSYRHDAPNTMPAGVGHHPWFATPEPDYEVGFHSGGEFHFGHDSLPDGHRVDPAQRRLSRADAGFNGCVSGWSGLACLRRPKAGLDVTLRADTGLLHCHVPQAATSVCLEPVSHRPGAAHDHRWPEHGAMRVLSAGQEISVTMDIRVSEHD